MVNDKKIAESVKKRQKVIELEDLPKGLKSKVRSLEDLASFFKKNSKFHSLMQKIEKIGQGGESDIYGADVPGVDVIIKLPRPDNEGNVDHESAMSETHFIEIIYDHKDYKSLVV